MSESENKSNSENINLSSGSQSDSVDTEKELALKQRILDLFIERAREVGTRAVSTDEIARTLSISKKTLYKQYSSKESIVKAVLDLWAIRVQAPVEISPGESPAKVILKAAQEWRDNDAKFCKQFWIDAGEDYPALRQQYFNTMYERMRPVSKQLRQFRKPEISEALTRETYYILVNSSVDKSFCERTELTVEEALLQLVQIWLNGCFTLPEVYPMIDESN